MAAIAAMTFTGAAAQDEADFYLPGLISDHAVMLRDADVKLWGWCPALWDLKIVCSWAPTDTVCVKSDKYNYWETSVRTPANEGPHSIRFYGWQGQLVREVSDILMGEPWLCSGQSNMEYCFRWEISDIDSRDNLFDNNKIRVFRVDKAPSRYPVERLRGHWELCSKEVMDYFSAVGYFFGRRLCEGLGEVPVGLVGAYWGGTPAEAWIDPVTFRDETLQKKAEAVRGDWPPVANSSLYNGMIFPLKNYTFAGVIWYQGEANNERYADYATMFSSLIRGWRADFGQRLPFYFVQIAPYSGYAGKNGAYLREQQAMVDETVEDTGMAVIGDLVNDINDVHPTVKRQVGERLANLALNSTYGVEGLNPFSPQFKSHKVSGNTVTVTTTDAGISSRSKKIKNFELLGSDGTLYPADAKILKNGDIRLTAKGLDKPCGVRYCFTNDAEPEIFGSNGLPLAPFRTDYE